MSDKEKNDDQPNFSGKYVLVRNENLNPFLAANGANWFFRKIAGIMSPELDITQDGSNFNIKLHSLHLTKESNFAVNEEFEEVHFISGSIMKVTPTWNGSKLVRKFEPKEVGGHGKSQSHTFELQDNELILTLQVDDITAKRVFRKTS